MSNEISFLIKGNASQAIDALKQTGAAAKDTGENLEKYFHKGEISARQLAFATRGLPAQFTDIAVSLQAGQNPFTVFMQQGGQIKDMFGGVGAATKAMSGYLLGLVGPWTIAGTAAGAFAYAMYKGSQEAHEYGKAMILSGNAAGVTVTRLAGMAENMHKTTGVSVGAAAEALAELTKNGNIASRDFEKFGAVAIGIQKLTGVAVADTVKQFAELAKDPLAASLKLNDATHFLTIEVYNQIKALELQGKTVEAGKLAQSAYADVMNIRIPQLTENLGYLEKSWKTVGEEAVRTWGSMLNIGRHVDPVTAVRNQLAELKSKIDSGVELYNGQRAAQIALLPVLEESLHIAQKAASAQQNSADAIAGQNLLKNAQIKLDEEHDKYQTKELQRKRELAAAEAIYSKAPQTPENKAQYREIVSGINKRYEDFGPAQERLSKTIGYYEVMQAIVVGGEKTIAEDIESEHKRKLISDRDYYTRAHDLAWDANIDQQALVELEIEAVKQSGIAKTEKASKIASYNTELARLKEEEVRIHQKAKNSISGIEDKANFDAAEAHVKYQNVLIGDIEKLDKQTEKQREAAKEYGLTKDAIGALRAAQLELQAVELERMAFRAREKNLDEGEYGLLMAKAKATRALAGADRDLGIKQFGVDTAKVLHDDVKNALTTAFRDSKDPLAAFGNALGNVIFTRVSNSLADALVTTFFNSSIGQGLKSIFGFADGGTFAANEPFANGGAFSNTVVSQATPFMFATGGRFNLGVMGEAGPEAVMPLRRDSSGRLGVMASGSNVINININASVGDIASKSDVVAGMRATASNIVQQIQRSQRYGGV